MKTLLRKLQACWHLLRAPRYLLYTALDEEGNLHRWNFSERVLGGDVSNLLGFGVEVGRDDTEATEALGDLLTNIDGVRAAHEWPEA
jgi:hypothetical protein